MNTTQNFSEKPITDFTPEDTIYIRKKKYGFSTDYLCEFIAYSGGVVTGKIISAEPNPKLHTGDHGKVISARITNCFLWKQDGELGVRGCQWFKKSSSSYSAS